jgi:hypothetical protein
MKMVRTVATSVSSVLLMQAASLAGAQSTAPLAGMASHKLQYACARQHRAAAAEFL